MIQVYLSLTYTFFDLPGILFFLAGSCFRYPGRSWGGLPISPSLTARPHTTQVETIKQVHFRSFFKNSKKSPIGYFMNIFRVMIYEI